MTESMTPERLAEIRTAVERNEHIVRTTAQIHRTELLAEVDRLNRRVAELEGNASALRGWTRSRLKVLADRRRDYPQTPENRAKAEVLDDLTRVLHHLDTIPAPDADIREQASDG